MTIPTNSLLLKIYIGEKYFSKGIPAYKEILWEAKKFGLGGATVIRCEMGLGHTGSIQEKENQKNNDLPVLIEIVDAPDKIHGFIPVAAALLGNHGLITTVSEVTVFHQGKLYDTPHAEEIRSYD